jgi:ABC-2 type transport system permease protein
MDKKIFIVAKREFLERVRSRWFILGTLAVPLLMTAIFGASVMMARTGASSSVRHIAIIDATGAGLGARIANVLMADSSLGSATDSARPSVRVVSASELPAAEAAAMSEVRQPKHLVGYLVLNDSTLKGVAARYAGRNASSISDIDKLSSVLRQEVMMTRLEREGVRQDIVGDLARNRLRLETERVTDSGKGGSGIAGVAVGFGIGIILFMSILIHGQNVMRGVLEEKTTRVAEVVISSVKPESLLGGKVLGVGAVGLTQQVAWIGISLFMINFVGPIMLKGTPMASAAAAGAASVPANPISSALAGVSAMLFVVAIIYFLIGFAFYATLYAAAGSMVNSEQEAQQAAVPVMLLAMSTWLLVNPVLAAPSGKLAVVLSWLPWSSPIIMPMRMGLTSVSPMSVVGSMLVALAGSVIAVWVSARIYRVGMLMYGKKPSMAEVAKWIRYA